MMLVQSRHYMEQQRHELNDMLTPKPAKLDEHIYIYIQYPIPNIEIYPQGIPPSHPTQPQAGAVRRGAGGGSMGYNTVHSVQYGTVQWIQEK